MPIKKKEDKTLKSFGTAIVTALTAVGVWVA